MPEPARPPLISFKKDFMPMVIQKLKSAGIVNEKLKASKYIWSTKITF